MHADRINRVMLTIVGIIALAIGVGGLLAAAGVFGSTFQHRFVFDNQLGRYFSDNGHWLWPVIAGVAFVIVLLALLWLLRLLFSTDRVGKVDAATPLVSRDQIPGRTTVHSSAVTRAVADEVESYRGVTGAKARMVGEPASATLVIEVSASRQTDVTELLHRINDEAVSHARQALENPQLPVKLDLSVNDKAVARAV